MPRNTNVVISIVSLTWSNSEPTVCDSPPQKLSAKVPASKANSTITRKTRIGTSLTTVMMRLITAACRTPRTIRRWKSQTSPEASTTASTVVPLSRPGKNSPSVVIVNTM